MYEDKKRSERAITLSTHDLEDLNGQSLLDLRAGDAVGVTFDDFNAEMLASERLSESQKYSILVDRGFSADAASAIVANYTKLAAYDRPLFLREVSFHYDSESGLSIEMELADFIVVGATQNSYASASGGRLGIGKDKKQEQAILGPT